MGKEDRFKLYNLINYVAVDTAGFYIIISKFKINDQRYVSQLFKNHRALVFFLSPLHSFCPTHTGGVFPKE